MSSMTARAMSAYSRDTMACMNIQNALAIVPW